MVLCYNSGKTVARAVIRQESTYPNIEVIAVDDGSTDTTTISIFTLSILP